MSIEEGQKKYVVDTNFLIGFALWNPFKFSTDFWDRITELLVEGKWILLDVVADEVKYEPDLKKWIKEQKHNHRVVKIDDDVRNRASEINNKYKMIDEISGKSEADTYIIAYAEINGFSVVSRESPRVNSNDLYKIPDVCKLLNIEHIRRPGTFMKKLDFNNLEH